MIEAEDAGQAPRLVLQPPHVDEASQGAGRRSAFVEAMHSDLRRTVAFDREYPQAAGHEGSRHAILSGTRFGETAGVLAYLLAGREAVLVVIELDVLGEDGIGLGRIAGHERGLEHRAIHAGELIEQGARIEPTG